MSGSLAGDAGESDGAGDHRPSSAFVSNRRHGADPAGITRLFGGGSGTFGVARSTRFGWPDRPKYPPFGINFPELIAVLPKIRLR